MIFGGSSLLGGSYYDAESESHRLIQEEQAETFIFRPMKSGGPNARAQPDPTRQVQVVRAIFQWEAKDMNLRSEGLMLSSRSPKITLHNCTLYHVRRRDVFERCVDGSQFEARAPQRDGMSGIEIELVELGIQD